MHLDALTANRKKLPNGSSCLRKFLLSTRLFSRKKCLPLSRMALQLHRHQGQQSMDALGRERLTDIGEGEIGDGGHRRCQIITHHAALIRPAREDWQQCGRTIIVRASPQSISEIHADRQIARHVEDTLL